ncbi:polysaccharide deacetylase family protein [Effusibacillus pohliae]|uniref:polysaccharide deacetylase family protein n=1 Tax=Effusibacillus pohliae TaxID=232270 RepID=UPI00037A18A8|nr:polysaccharide deacetylase family protein [Effusibacillus pohliae]
MNKWVLTIALCSLVLSGCASKTQPRANVRTPPAPPVAQVQAQTPNLEDGKEHDVREPHPLSLADLRRKYPSTFILSGPPTKRQVALTFDDGPDTVFTPQVLDVLKRYHVKATFFVVGNRALAHPELVQRMVREGHVVGNHSFSHANLPKLSDDQFHYQILHTEEILRPLIGYNPKLVRPPYGNINEPQILWLAGQGFKIINWNVDSLDWKGLNAAQVSTNVLAHVHPGNIILQHCAGGHGEDLTGTVQALPRIIEKLRADGVQFVTVPDLLNLPASR